MDRNSKLAALNQAAQAEAEVQAENLVADFDQALEEWRDQEKPFKVKFKGQIFNIPRQKPFGFAIFVSRHCIKKEGGKTIFRVEDEYVDQYLRLMFGEEFMEALEGSEAEHDFIFERIVPTILALWGAPIKGKNTEGTPVS